MIKLLKNSFVLLKQNSIYIQPIILFFILISFLDGFALKLRYLTIANIVLTIGLFLLFIAVITGWFYICRLAVNDLKTRSDDQNENNMRSYETFKKYFTGVGENIAGTLVINISWFILSLIIGYFSCKYFAHKIGSPRPIFELITSLALAPEANRMQIMQNFYTVKNVILVFAWFSASFIFINLNSFIFTLLNVVYSTLKGNPFVAMCKTFLFCLKTFFKTLLLFILILFCSFVLYVLLALSSINVILSVIALLIVFLYFNYIVFLVFLYYDEETKSNCNCGSKLNREI